MTEQRNTKDVALVLSSGGARGLAHIGAIEELLSRGYRITSIAGSSMGALVGGVYAAGKLEEFREWLKNIDDKKKMLGLIDFSLSINHLAKGDRIIEAIMEFVPDIAIEDLPIPYCAVATDLASGREIVFDKGSLFKAIRASISLPTFYKPVEREGMVLIDGAVINPIPLNRVKRHEGDILVGVDVNVHDFKSQWEEMHKETEQKKDDASLKEKILDKLIPDDIKFNYYTVLLRASRMMIHQNSILMAELMKPDILVDVPSNKYGVFDFDKSGKIIAMGKQKMSQAINRYESSEEPEKGYMHYLKKFTDFVQTII